MLTLMVDIFELKLRSKNKFYLKFPSKNFTQTKATVRLNYPHGRLSTRMQKDTQLFFITFIILMCHFFTF